MKKYQNQPKCLLTNSDDIELLEEIETRDIVQLYKENFHLNVEKEFKNTSKIYLYRSKAGLYFFHPIITGSEEFYEHLQKSKFYYPEERGEFHYAAQFIRPGQKVLEVGCGTGAFSRFLPQVTYMGIEYNELAVQKARAKGIKVIKDSIENYSETYKNWYDVVCAFQVLEHVANPYTFVQSCVRSTLPGGIIIFSVPNANSFLKWLPNNVLITPPHHVTIWTEQALRNIALLFALRIIDLRFELLSARHAGDFLFALINHAINHGLNKKDTLLKNISFYKVFQRIGRHLCRRIAPFVLPHNTFVGHSLYVVYQKGETR